MLPRPGIVPPTIEVDGTQYSIQAKDSGEDFSFVLTAPDCPNCIVVHDDLHVAIEEMKDKIREWRASTGQEQ